MAIIDLTFEKPALKRTEVVEATDETASTATDESSTTSSRSGGRLRRTVGLAGAVAVGVGSLVTLRKLRNRRKNKGGAEDAAE